MVEEYFKNKKAAVWYFTKDCSNCEVTRSVVVEFKQ